MAVSILIGDVREKLAELADESVHCVVTSPPYWGLRDYGGKPKVWGGDAACLHQWGEWSEKDDEREQTTEGKSRTTDRYYGEESRRFDGNHQKHTAGAFCQKCSAWRGQLGLEPTIELYVQHMVEVFRDVRRVLRKDGTLWLNMGDCYAGGGRGAGSEDCRQRTNAGSLVGPGAVPGKVPAGLAAKQLIGQPWRVAFALQGLVVFPGAALNNAADLLADAREAGDWESVRGVEGMLRAWARASAFLDPCWLRSDIVWAKPNPMPESCRDRPTKSHEYVFMLTKAAKYFFDQEAVRETGLTDAKAVIARVEAARKAKSRGKIGEVSNLENWGAQEAWSDGRRNIRSVWNIATQPFPEAHFATFPESLPERCIRAGTSERGCCPQCGAPWVRVVESNPDYKKAVPDGWTLAPTNWDTEDGAHQMEKRDRSATRRMAKGAHPATLPQKNITTGWQPSCKHGGDPIPCTVLDPFMGSGTTALVALKLTRSVIGIELNAEYAEMARRRLEREVPLLMGAV